MDSTSLAQAPTAKRSTLLPLGVAFLAAASYAAGIITPTILGTPTVSTSTTTIQQSAATARPDRSNLPGGLTPKHRIQRVEHGPTQY